MFSRTSAGKTASPLLSLSIVLLVAASCSTKAESGPESTDVTDALALDQRGSDTGPGDAAQEVGTETRAQDLVSPQDGTGELDVSDGLAESDAADLAEDEADAVEPPKPLVAEAGFIEIEPVNFVIHSGWQEKSYTSSKARMWYVFQPAESDPESRPLAIFFNGGPGSSTSLLFGFNTGKYTVDPLVTQGEPFAANPNSWTQFANLLYVDARETGFSYNMLVDVYLNTKRKNEFGTKNFNSLLDGADFVRVLLRFLAAHPALQANPVLIVGESYGGIRSTVMSYLLLNYSEMGEGTLVYEDKALAQEIQTHLEKVFPDQTGSRVPREVIASQFGHMALIQPLISGDYQSEVAGAMFRQSGSIIYSVAEQTGTSYQPCQAGSWHCDDEEEALMFVYSVAERDLYNVSQPLGWMDAASAAINLLLVEPETLAQLLQVDILTIPELFKENRTEGYRWGEIPDLPNIDFPPAPHPLLKASSGERLPSIGHRAATAPSAGQAPLPGHEALELAKALKQAPAQLPFAARLLSARAQVHYNRAEVQPQGLEMVFGILRNWDQFFVGLHEEVNQTFYMSDADTLKIEPYNNIYGEMFLYDIRYIKTFITRSAYDIVIYAPAIPEALCMHDDLVSQCAYMPGEADERLGSIEFTYLSGAFAGEEGPATATVLFPTYSNSGHPVEVTEPELLLEDVISWYFGEL